MLIDPLFLLASFLLALNDHVLKSAAPGIITGKLSDVAGLALAPVLAVSLGELFGAGPIDEQRRMRRLAFWAVATATGFSAIELLEPAAWAYSHLLGAVQSLPRVLVARSTHDTPVWAVARHVADPADLLTLPFCASGLARVALCGGRESTGRRRARHTTLPVNVAGLPRPRDPRAASWR